MMRVHVTKMHGSQNDFLILDRRVARIDDPVSFARWACDRRTGIGADGAIILEGSQLGDVKMRTINADGSEAEMCGNGIRCAARWLDEAGEGERISFETDAGLIRTEVVSRGPEYLVRVGVGWPRITSRVPRSSPETTVVEIGNPHVVVFEAESHTFDLESFARELQHDSAFPNGTNVHLTAVLGAHAIQVRHWERGVGLTQACGTGAVASAAVALVNQLATSPIDVFAPGGRVVVEWDGAREAFLTGPAARIFDTEIDVETRLVR